jgi:hypothetical protein
VRHPLAHRHAGVTDHAGNKHSFPLSPRYNLLMRLGMKFV